MSATDPARDRRDELLVWNGAEILDLDLSALPDQTALHDATRACLAALLDLPRPGCDRCGKPATFAHLDDQTADLACDKCDPGGYHVKLAELTADGFDWVEHIGGKCWGLIALIRLIGRLEDEEQIRQLREMRGEGDGRVSDE